MDDEKVPATEVSRREAIRSALVAAAYAAPAILTAAVPAPAGAQVSGATATLTGTVTDATTAVPIAGATVEVGGVSATTDSSGRYAIPGAPVGTQAVTVSAAGYTTRTNNVTIFPAGTNYTTALVPDSSGNNITIVLNWGAVPQDLDAHLTGPIAGSSSRFHCYYGNPSPVPYVRLDVDVTNGFGPETNTVKPSGAAFVPGVYRHYVHNYSGSPGFNASPATVAVFQGGVQIAQFQASAATGSPTSTIWSVFTFTLSATATGDIVIIPVQQYTTSAPADMALTPGSKK